MDNIYNDAEYNRQIIKACDRIIGNNLEHLEEVILEHGTLNTKKEISLAGKDYLNYLIENNIK